MQPIALTVFKNMTVVRPPKRKIQRINGQRKFKTPAGTRHALSAAHEVPQIRYIWGECEASYMDNLAKSSSSGLGPARGLRTFSRRSRRVSASSSSLMSSFSYRRNRARRRQIFLRTYRLASVKGLGSSGWKAPEFKKVVAKLKEVLVSAVSFARSRSFGSCNCQSAISASHPQAVKKIRVFG